MKTLRCIVSHTPVRAEAKESSEMISELLFGEAVLPLELAVKWVKVQCSWDDYVGWVDRKQLAEFPSTEAFHLVTKPEVKVIGASGKIKLSGGSLFDASGKLRLETGMYSLSKSAFARSSDAKKKQLLDFAIEFLHAPYLWGGRSIWGIDCSGFTQVCFAQIGIELPRDSKDQAERGEKVSKAADLRAGDVAFFQNENGQIMHVGIVTRKGKIIHSSGQVRVDSLDERGIVVKPKGTVSHKWAWGIKLKSLT